MEVIVHTADCPFDAGVCGCGATDRHYLLRVVRAAEHYADETLDEGNRIVWGVELREALEALPEHLKEEK